MLLIPKVCLLRCPCNNSLFRTILIFTPVIAFLFILMACLKWSTYLTPLENEIVRYSKADSQIKNAQMKLFSFPYVRELVFNSNTKFYNEDARRVALPVEQGDIVTKMNSSLKIIYLATTYFGEWNPRHYYFFHLGDATFTRYLCPISNCYVTKKSSDIFKADAVLFHARDLEVFSFPRHRSPEQLWILYSMEPPWLEIRDFRRFNGLFNWTMSYRRGSDVLVKYGFIGRKPKNDVNGKHTKSYSDILKHKIHKAVWYVSNCNTDSNREQYVERLRTVYPVDVIGGCGTPGCRPPETKKCYSKIAKRYKFYLAFENAICRDYVTEKLYNPLEYDIVPVVLGGADYTSLTPNGSVINAMDFSSPEDLGKYLWKVSRNDTLYLSYFKWKENFRSYLQPWMCDLCEKLHSSQSFRTHSDLQSWWNEDNSCLKWTSSGFKRIKNHVFPKYNVKLFENTTNHSERVE